MRMIITLAAVAVLMVLSALCASAATVTVCQCNIYEGGRWTERDDSVRTYDTARRFAQWVATVNPPPSAHPPISVIGMQEVLTETDRATMHQLLEQHTGQVWSSHRVAQGVNGGSGIAIFWRPDMLEHAPGWDLGSKAVGQIDNGYVIKFMGKLFRLTGTEEAFGLFTGKLVWGDAIYNGQVVTEEYRRQQAVILKDWIRNGDENGPGMSAFPGTTRVITTDLNTDTGTATWNEMNLEFADPSSQHTHNSFSGQFLMDLVGKRLDYVWWDYDAFTKRSGGYSRNPERSAHVGSDHRAVYATVNLHPVDLAPPQVAIAEPLSGAVVDGSVVVQASASDESGILQVEFLLDGEVTWTDTAAPYTWNWNAAASAEGLHTLAAVATDASSNRLKQQSAPVYVWKGAGNTGPRIFDIKMQPDGTEVLAADKVVSAVFGNMFYIQDPDRSAGIRVSGLPVPALGESVAVAGKLNTLNGERLISAQSVQVLAAGEAPVPLGISNKDVGGGGVGDHTPGVDGGSGVHNSGLLVRTWGTVTRASNGFYFYIDDGSGLHDGSGNTGVRVDVSGAAGLEAPQVGDYVRVTGISTTVLVKGRLQRNVMVRSSGDVTVTDPLTSN